MDNKTNDKQQASPSDVNLPSEKAFCPADLATKIKTEATTSKTYNKTNIKVEANEGQCFHKNLESNVENDTITHNYGFEMDSKINIKQETFVTETELPNVEYLDCTSIATKLENDTVTSNDCKKNSKDKEESDLGTDGTLSSNPLRFTSTVVYHDRSSHNDPYTSDVGTSSGNNVDNETSMRQNMCSLNCNPAGGFQHLESVEDTEGESIQVYKCQVCEKKFSCPLKLKRHSLCHSQRKSFKCKHCDKCFTWKSDLKSHALVHNGLKPFICEYCNKCFTWKSHLISHILVHIGSKPYKCEHCGKCFTQKSNLQAHTSLHSSIKPYKCEHCGKCFTQKPYLKSHALVHTGSKPFQCAHCGKCFTWKSHLKSHTLFHTSLNQYKCEHCDKCFTHKSNLKAHTLRHSGIKPYKCQDCDRCFAERSDLKRHALVHLGTKPYKCEHCDKCFTRKSHLERHIVSLKHKTSIM